MVTKKIFINKLESGLLGIHVSFWIVIFSLSIYFIALLSNGGYLFQRTLVLLAVNMILFYACYSWIVPNYIQKKRNMTSITLILGLVIVISVLSTAGDRLLLDKFNWEPVYNIPQRGRFIMMFFGELTFGVFASLIRMVVDSNKNKRRLAELEKLQLNTELQFLKAQLSPHFLFNSINNIYSLVLLKSDKAPEALMKMSELLRYSLYDCHNKVSLQQEIEALESYIELFKLKYEDKIRLEFTKNALNINYQIEPLLYIPLLENALKYSGIGNNPNAFIQLKIWQENNMLVFHICNNKGTYNKNQEASGIGLTNIKKRLENIYPDNHILEILEEEDKFDVILKINM